MSPVTAIEAFRDNLIKAHWNLDYLAFCARLGLLLEDKQSAVKWEEFQRLGRGLSAFTTDDLLKLV